jgi:hypothetical protein
MDEDNRIKWCLSILSCLLQTLSAKKQHCAPTRAACCMLQCNMLHVAHTYATCCTHTIGIFQFLLCECNMLRMWGEWRLHFILWRLGSTWRLGSKRRLVSKLTAEEVVWRLYKFCEDWNYSTKQCSR